MPFHVPSPGQAAGALHVDPTVVSAVRAASVQSGARFDTLMASAAIESGFNPSAKAGTSSASGLFQFTEQTWLEAMRQNGGAHGMSAEAAAVVRRGNRLTVEDPALRRKILDLRNDPQAAASLAGDHLQNIAAKLNAVTGRAPDAAEVYLGHFLGSGGASQMLQAVQSTPDRAAASILPEAAQANRRMFYAADGSAYSASQFMQNLRGRVEKAYAAVGSAMPTGPLNFASATPAATSKADPAEAETTGWGSTTPVKRVAAPERLMLATLADVFTRLDHANGHTGKAGDRRLHTLPAGMLTALQSAQ